MLEHKEYLDKLYSSCIEVLENSLGANNFRKLEIQENYNEPFFGAQVRILGEKGSHFLLFLSDPKGCQEIAEKYTANFDLEEDELIPSIDHIDAFNELINMIAGVMSREIEEHEPMLKIDIPITLDGDLMGQDSTGFLFLALQSADLPVITLGIKYETQ